MPKFKVSNRNLFIIILLVLGVVLVTENINQGACLFNYGQQSKREGEELDSEPSYSHAVQRVTTTTSLEELDAITKDILGPDAYGQGCPKTCGCPQTKVDCPQHYQIKDIDKSAKALLDTQVSLALESRLEAQHLEASEGCRAGQQNAALGGWCLGQRQHNEMLELPDGRQIKIPRGHVAASQRILATTADLFLAENVTSVSDYGAGVGQYGVELKKLLPHLVYRGYDGAGDVESYTSGFLKYSDFTLPLNNQVTEWVLGLEVGEHIPSKFEGMFIRNLHRHNCKGIVLSWGVLGQGGENHINLHTNEYVARIFQELGYSRDMKLETDLRNPSNNHRWFVQSTMAFRRINPTC